ncbi:hypothetical protein, partial [Acetobacter tropicalis]|uniref:hypothetical protein n=1 Tax=Acetobacter tropicalis TaxID=104102 RepID=UPI001E48090B
GPCGRAVREAVTLCAGCGVGSPGACLPVMRSVTGRSRSRPAPLTRLLLPLPRIARPGIRTVFLLPPPLRLHALPSHLTLRPASVPPSPIP